MTKNLHLIDRYRIKDGLVLFMFHLNHLPKAGCIDIMSKIVIGRFYTTSQNPHSFETYFKP